MKQFTLKLIVFALFQTGFGQISDSINSKDVDYETKMELLTSRIKVENQAKKTTRKNLDGTTLSEFNLEDIHGNLYSLESLKDQVVLINFWFINCKPCVAEIPDLNALKSEFAGENVKFIAVALDRKAALETFLEKTTFDFTIIPNGNSLATGLGIPHYPYNVLIDKTGKLHYINEALSINMMNRINRKIKKLLK